MLKQFAVMTLLAIPGVATAGDRQCPEVEAPPAPVCVSTPHGLAYADTGEEAHRAADALGDAARHYMLHFGRAPVGTLILSTDLDPLVANDHARAHGLDYAQVWLPASAKRAMTERAMRQAGVDRAGITRALAGAAEREAVTLRHEVGHAMYAAMYWPHAAGASLQVRYGTPAPDWLDEAVAILMEPPEAQARHLESFIDAAKHRPQTIPGLTDFLQAEHPVRSAALARALSRGPRSGSGVQMVVADGGEFPGVDSFYGQSLLLALFLAETSGDPRILVPISAAVAGGATFDQWLASDGAAHGLPIDVPALQALWDGWLKSQVFQRGRGGKG
ncbi:hypothetical protein [Luteimonas sp. MC1750]|uniref:hypothetical protein n=1 Tax=Luteimonas sp. MC1750 TaxID=2799326 RepID=UPI0018F0D2EA|nr:hypothetical protein [Luteimonas sp. MC1750]MBJ6983039.1 hypothetical protein [Luteimonas sp. MC1750]QQO05245.1 hypothetical protein JGR68_10360 [Luteimonas sp. MC1750]